jgi:hypothetical protein
MTLSVIGAGVGRTGTMSLKKALSNILGGDCYHMVEIFPRPEHIPVWHAAAKGKIPNWGDFLRDFKAAVDWPASAFWEELAGAYPNAIIVLSYRDPEEWWQSASETIFPALVDAEDTPWRRMIFEVLKQRFTAEIESKEKSILAYLKHNARVESAAPPDRLLRWRAEDGWEPLCEKLEMEIPDGTFPHLNSKLDFKNKASGSATSRN